MGMFYNKIKSISQMVVYFLPFFKDLILAYEIPRERTTVTLRSTALEGHFVKSNSLS